MRVNLIRLSLNSWESLDMALAYTKSEYIANIFAYGLKLIRCPETAFDLPLSLWPCVPHRKAQVTPFPTSVKSTLFF